MMACWNHPFEVARIEAQARGDQNQKDLNMVQIFRMIVKEQVFAPMMRCLDNLNAGDWIVLQMSSSLAWAHKLSDTCIADCRILLT